MRRPVAFTAVFVTIVLSAAVARLPAEQTTTTQTELLAEVRLLRQAIESLAGTNARVQIVFGRLQLQDQRTEAAAKRLDAARDALNDVNNRITQMGDHVKSSENALDDPRRKPEDIEAIQNDLRSARRELERLEVERTMRAAAEVDAAGILNQEQGRWSDLNRQLEELERALAKQ